MQVDTFELDYRNLIGGTLIAFGLLLSGCGGGGGGGAAADAPAAAEVAADPAPANSSGGSGGSGGSGAGGSGGSTSTALVLGTPTPANYEWASLASGAAVYVDRSFTFTGIPVDLQDLDYLRTANDDKFVSDPVAVSFSVSQPVTVLVAYDSTLSALPGWLASWTDSGVQLQNTDVALDVYQRDFPAGTVNLGGNEMGGSMYSVAVMLQGGGIGGPLVIAGTPPTSSTDGVAYNFAPTTSGGSGGVTFSISNPPPWLNFNTGTGVLSGTPGIGDVGTAGGIVISVTDGQSTTASLAAFSITVLATSTGTATLSWTAPTLNADNTPLLDLSGYKVYYGTSDGNYPNFVNITNPGVTTGVVENLAPGTWSFVVTAYDDFGNESGFSNIARKTITAM